MRKRRLDSETNGRSGGPRLENGSRVAVIGGGPAGSLFSYFFLDMAARVDLEVAVDIYERKDFSGKGPAGCNMCGGVVSESMVQALAAEGINIPNTVVQRGIDSYVLHMDEGSLRIDTPLHEKRIAAVSRGAGPRGNKEMHWRSFDGYLLELAASKGARHVAQRVENVSWVDGRPEIKDRNGTTQVYDLLVVATGVNSTSLKIFEGLGLNYERPRTVKTYISEYRLGEEMVKGLLGSSMHVFLLRIPKLEFAAIIPKGNYATLCLLGHDINKELVSTFLAHPEVRQCLPVDQQEQLACHCSPKINVRECLQPFADRMVFIGDCGVTRLYKDGIGAAYRTSKAAARTAVFQGIGARDFRRHYRPMCRVISHDNKIGKMIFAVTRIMQKVRYARMGILCMVSKEQHKPGGRRRMSTVLWDTFTGSAPYRSVLLRTLHPLFVLRLVWSVCVGSWLSIRMENLCQDATESSGLGKVYLDGEKIIREGEDGCCMFVIQEGRVEVVTNKSNHEVQLAILEAGDSFGEMALFEHEVRSATVRAVGKARVLTVDKKAFLSNVQQDPSLAFRIVQSMSRRLRKMNDEMTRLKAGPCPPEAK
jgi:flavin-dependent dehydrogenase